MRPFLLVTLMLLLGPATLGAETLYTSRKINTLREGAGAYHMLVGSVPENTALSVVARSGFWVKVQLANKQIGWISTNSLKAEKSAALVARTQESMWSSPRALSAAIKGFGKKYVDGNPGFVDSVMAYTEKHFTQDDLEAFTEELRESRSKNRERVEIDDLDLPEPEYYPDLPEHQIGVSVAARIAGAGIVRSKSLHRYLNMVCAAIAEQSSVYDVNFTVLVLNEKTINAFAVPGGYIFVTLGLVNQCRDESELAGVIAHEIAHVYRRHGLQELSKRIVALRSGAAFGELEEEVGGMTEDEAEMEELVDDTYERVVHPRLLSYELEADKVGAILAADAGYDPHGLVRVSERVAGVSKQTPDLFDADFMRPDDAVKRAEEISVFVKKHFTTESPGEQMTTRFTAAISQAR